MEEELEGMGEGGALGVGAGGRPRSLLKPKLPPIRRPVDDDDVEGGGGDDFDGLAARSRSSTPAARWKGGEEGNDFDGMAARARSSTPTVSR